ncbi:tRNA (guanine(46)-N(7))-methyltransferase TrmB [Amaricoccus macauensis]|uniref:tRNA (guanine(46)-N(7))-methyltransferase TrmB n=1 Tax=Amaricoccus macauensis TaxID=57001 RepID=UPI003C79871B
MPIDNETGDDGGLRNRRKLYGRRKGKPLRASQERLMAEVLPSLKVNLGDTEARPGALEPAEIFGRLPAQFWLEIGFGGGEHLAHQAIENPDVGIVGCEPFVNGIAMLLSRLEREEIGNVRVHPSDARDLIDRLPDGALDKAFLLYPDPWPKARHHRRRFMNPENLRPLARAMRAGAELRLATDIPDYMEHALEAVGQCSGLLELAAPVATGRDNAWLDWPGTRYEAKAIRAGRVPQYATFRRV